MPESTSQLEMRPAVLEDAELAADLEATRDPDAPLDPVLLRHWWHEAETLEVAMRRIAVRDGEAIAYAGSAHQHWKDGEKRYGVIRIVLRADVWSDPAYGSLVRLAEEWVRREGAAISVARIREDFDRDLAAIKSLGYAEIRQMRISELDLVAQREKILDTREVCRQRMSEQGVRMLVLSDDPDPERYRKLHKMVVESEQDIPSVMPRRAFDFEEWKSFWFGNPAMREDRLWIAREGNEIVGTSVLDTPVVRGIPFTAYTGTSRAVRGRGIARALKYESLSQAVEAGYSRARTKVMAWSACPAAGAAS